MRTIDDYIALVPPEHANKPKFIATLRATLQPFADAQAFLDNLPEEFDIDTAVGVQLDVVGQWVGITRFVPVPIPNAFFSFDVQGLGFDEGYWFGTFDDPSTYLARLDDDTYRRLLYAKRLCNISKGRIADIAAALSAFYNAPGQYVFVLDTSLPPEPLFFSFDDPLRGFDVGFWYEGEPLSIYSQLDMKITVGIAGTLPTVVELEVLHQMLLPFKPAGARIEWAITTLDGAPVAACDVETIYLAGCDVGAFGEDPDWVARNVVLAP